METIQGSQPVSNSVVGPAAATAVTAARPRPGSHRCRVRARSPPPSAIQLIPRAAYNDAVDAPTSTAPEGTQTREGASS
jgi:hypothetical protein